MFFETLFLKLSLLLLVKELRKKKKQPKTTRAVRQDLSQWVVTTVVQQRKTTEFNTKVTKLEIQLNFHVWAQVSKMKLEK